MPRKLILIPGVIILLIMLFIFQDLFAPPDRRMIFKASIPSQTNTNPNSALKYETTDYKNSLPLSWKETNFEIRNPDTTAAPETKSMYKVADVDYCNAGDQKLLLDLYTNQPLKPGSLRPMVVYIHGGGMLAGDKAEIDTPPAKVITGLVENDFIVASVNYQLAPKYKYPAMIQDILCAVRFLKYYSYGIGGDQNKIGVFGDSVGGQLSTLVGATSGVESWENSPSVQIAGANLASEEYLKIPTKPNAVVGYYIGDLPEGVIARTIIQNMGQRWHNPFDNKDYPIVEMFKMIYNFDPAIMHEARPVNFVTANEPPFLIVQGDKDTLTPAAEAATLYDKLKSENDNAQFLIVKNANHGFEPNPEGAVMNPSLDEVVNTTVDFFKSHLE
ncbi:MAG: alpha/beta hydrolase [Patescibacteria group bacterium]|nr:alpha/beta hydrolase [Patescibacteria group bacterium]